MFISYWVLPYFYDQFLNRGYIDQTLYERLREYYQYIHRELLKVQSNEFWKYATLYNWRKHNFIPTTEWNKEKEIAQESIKWTADSFREEMKEYIETLPALPNYVIPPPEPSLFEKMMQRETVLSSNSTKPKINRPKRKKNRKKKHKDNRKRGNKKEDNYRLLEVIGY